MEEQLNISPEESRRQAAEPKKDHLTNSKNHSKVSIHMAICRKLNEVYERKNNDYGDSFAHLRKEFDNAILIRLSDKYRRLKTLKSGAVQQVADESIRDTLLDLANYCIMELVEMEVDEHEGK